MSEEQRFGDGQDNYLQGMRQAAEAARQALACSNASDALAISEALLRKSAPELANI